MKRLGNILFARVLFAVARLCDEMELHRLSFRATNAAIRCIHAGNVRRHVRFSP